MKEKDIEYTLGRTISEEFENKLDKEFHFIIDYVKENKHEVFLGIRKNKISLYVNGGKFFNVEETVKETEKGYLASFNSDSYIKDEKLENLKKKIQNINNKNLDKKTIPLWKDVLDELKDIVSSHMFKHKTGKGNQSYKEKILQQKLALAFNNQNVYPYFTYDIEYNIESLNDYYYKKDGTPDKSREPHTLGRMDNMMIGIDENNQLTLYLMEIKNGMNAITTTNLNSKSQKQNYESFGNGIIGHINLYMTIIKYIKSGEDYVSKYKQDKKLPNASINIRNHIFSEIRSTMKFYKKYDLIENPAFKKLNYDDIKFNDVKLVFYLGEYNKNSKKLETHLGIEGNNNDSVMNLINNNKSEYQYVKEIYDFKYYKDEKAFNDELNISDLNIENYYEIKIIQNEEKIKLEKIEK